MTQVLWPLIPLFPFPRVLKLSVGSRWSCLPVNLEILKWADRSPDRSTTMGKGKISVERGSSGIVCFCMGSLAGGGLE